MNTDREMIYGVEMPKPDVPLVRGGCYPTTPTHFKG